MGICHDISEELLRKSWKQFPGNPRNWFWRNFLWKFPRISTSTFSTGFLQNWQQESPWKWLQEIPWIWLLEIPRNGLLEIPRTWFLEMGFEKFLGKAVNIFTGFSCERFLGISADSQERFLGIFADYPQNCYLGGWLTTELNWLTACRLVTWRAAPYPNYLKATRTDPRTCPITMAGRAARALAENWPVKETQ